jgi:hypothetical protein
MTLHKGYFQFVNLQDTDYDLKMGNVCLKDTINHGQWQTGNIWKCQVETILQCVQTSVTQILMASLLRVGTQDVQQQRTVKCCFVLASLGAYYMEYKHYN